MQLKTQARSEAIAKDLLNARSGYSDRWRRVTSDWRNAAQGYYGWLTYAANYLFSFNGYKWGLDTFAMPTRIQGMPTPDYQTDLAPLSMMVLTHAHNDHLDQNLIKALKDTEVAWVIPEYVQEVLRAAGTLPERRIITPVPGQLIQIGALRLLPFKSLHLHGAHGVPETGYLVECDGMRWLFPGDIRVYDIGRLPMFGNLDGALAHLWLGKARALDKEPPFLDDFCKFFSALDTEQVFITHLNEFGRDEKDLWRVEHFELVKAVMLKYKPALRVEKFLMGDRMVLNPTKRRMEREA